ncbi:MAG: hypothetical protein HRU01_09390 [Myxococcales bacterium]|nr:hypothetical protein [Myxococcales bacterium]
MDARSLHQTIVLPLLAGLLWLGAPHARAGDVGTAGEASNFLPTSTIDVLVVYPRPAAEHLASLIAWNRAWGETEMGAFLDANFARVTQIYQQSGIPVEFRIVHHEAVDFSNIDPNNWKATLSFALMSPGDPIAAHIPYLDVVGPLRELHGADLLIYWRQIGDAGPTSNGANPGGGADKAYAQLTYTGVNPPIAAHETGHLLGGQHQNGVQGTASFSIAGDTAQLREYRTVMTVAVPLGLDAYRYVWRFSNAGDSVAGDNDCSAFSAVLETCHFPDTVSLGDASHDSASILSAMAPVVAGFRSPASPVVVPAAPVWAQGLLGLVLAGAGVGVLLGPQRTALPPALTRRRRTRS